MSTVVTQAYNMAGNGGRNLVRLSNGWLVVVLSYGSTSKALRFDISKDNGDTWSLLGTIQQQNGAYKPSLASFGTMVYCAFQVQQSVGAFHSFDAVDIVTPFTLYNQNKWFDAAANIGGGNLQSTNSIAVDSNGVIHIVHATTTTSLTTSYNLRYTKSTDGGVTWDAVTQLTSAHNSQLHYISPTIVIYNGNPVIISHYNSGTSAYYIYSHRFDGSKWRMHTMLYNGDALSQTNPSAVIDKEGVIHVAWSGFTPTNTTRKQILYSKSTDGGVTWSAMEQLTNESAEQGHPSLTVDKKGKLFIFHGGAVGATIYVRYMYKNGTNWSGQTNVAITNSWDQASTLYDPTFSGEFGEIPPTVYLETGANTGVRYIGTYTTNDAPTLTLNTPNNETLYENDTFKIDGSAVDTDIGNIVNVKYRINSESVRAITVNISAGTEIPFNKQLTFKGGILFDGTTAVTATLNEGVGHTLKVWAEDDQGGKSTEQIRTFYVVPNRAPALTVDSFTDQSEMINNDKIKIAGSSSDPDGNDVTVKYRVNEEAAVQIHSGVAGPWSFDLSLKSLKDGENIIVIEVTDTYNFKSSKTIKLNKTANLTPLEHSVQRYKIVPPSGSAQGVLLWIQRDATQEVVAEISMTTGAEQEQFVPLSLENSAPVGAEVEDYFKYRADAPAEHISLKLSWTGDKPITLISGALLQ